MYLKELNLLLLFLLLYKDAGTHHLQKNHKDSEVWFSMCPRGTGSHQQLPLLFLLPESINPNKIIQLHQYYIQSTLA
jgi:hypothetical protein